ncbi:MAG: nucleoside-diphosphate-sugar epimerase [Gammaproteobacteria bacterium]|jgi:nucleoside-diphosphate-sugar epimerase
MTASKQNPILIIGCGYLGMRLASQITKKGMQVWATSRKEEKISRIRDAGAVDVLFDLNDPVSWKNLNFAKKSAVDIYFLLPPGQIELDTLNLFLALIHTWQVGRLVMTSSTVVYGGRARVVDADSKVDIDNDRAKRQYGIEQAVANYGGDVRIVRLAGLYGPDRIIGRQSVLNSQAIEGNADNHLNLIHVDDAAALLMTIMSSASAMAVELGSDGVPISRGRYYSDLAKFLGCKAPLFRENESNRGGNRQCDNTVTRTRTGWVPHYTDYRQAWQ